MSKINATTALDTFRLDTATHRDAPRIAEIHMAAFGPNAMLHAQFPTPAIRQQLQICITEKAFADIDDPKTTVLVVTNSEDYVVAFAKWSHPIQPDEDYVEPPWLWPEGTNLDTLNAWIAKADQAEKRSVGKGPCYRLSFIGTDPTYSRRGAGTLLVQWGVQQSDASGFPCYLESTVDAAPFYKKNGFMVGETISLPICLDGGTEMQIYEEIVCTYTPP